MLFHRFLDVSMIWRKWWRRSCALSPCGTLLIFPAAAAWTKLVSPDFHGLCPIAPRAWITSHQQDCTANQNPLAVPLESIGRLGGSEGQSCQARSPSALSLAVFAAGAAAPALGATYASYL